MDTNNQTVAVEEKKVPEVKTAVKVEKKEEKAAKAEIVIKDLKLPKEIIVKVMTTCTSFVNAKGNKWYLKGRTLEITTPVAALSKRVEKFSKEVIEKCHLGHVTCCIRDIADTDDLQSILSKHFLHSAKWETKEKVTPAPKKKTATPTVPSTTPETPAA